MQLLDWIRQNRPGVETRFHDRVEFRHPDGDVSTIWLAPPSRDLPAGLQSLHDLYLLFDGADLFSSTFKVASLHESHGNGEVLLTPTLKQFAMWAAQALPAAPPDQVWFMTQAGGWFYAVSAETGEVVEWDSESTQISGHYHSIFEVFQEWVSAVS